MPKVNVYPPGPADDLTRRVEVGWRSSGDVQIAVTVLQNPSNLTMDGPNEPTWDGQWVDLDRRGINDLIRALREARDKAYGRDE